MKPQHFVITAAVCGVLGALAGVVVQKLNPKELPVSPSGTDKVQPLATTLPDFRFPDLEGRSRLSAEWMDKTLVLNFWATWCPPCRKEMPGFARLQEKYRDKGVRFVGIAVDDKQSTQDFVDTYGVEYVILLGDLKAMALSKRLGNRLGGLPFTIVSRPGGRIELRHTGELKEADLDRRLAELTHSG